MKKSRGIIIIILTVLIIAGLSFMEAVGFGSGKTGNIREINLGLDLAGGVSITYEASKENPTEVEMSDTIYKLQKRVEGYSTESEVYQEGSNRINVDIPGVSDANTILEELGKPGSIEFQTEDGTTVLSGTDIADAQAATTQDDMGNKQYVVELTFTDEAAATFAQITADNIGKTLAIVYDEAVISAPTVKSAIEGGKAYIDGMSSYEEAEQLASAIRIGSLKLELTELRSNVVGAKLGQEAISTSLKAGAIGLVLIIIFMTVFYLLPGFVSGIALTLYLALTLAMLNLFDITLTLPGIAGIVLSLGMAVDANVIIFARIREELTAGKTVKSAMKLGFHKALSAIIDGNVTTLIAAVVLGIKGTGTVKGFAMTLGLGVVLSMFTALFVTKALLNAFYALGFTDPKFYGRQKERKTIDFLGKKNVFFIVSLALILSGFVFLGVNKSQTGSILNYSMEFRGGTSTNVTFNEDMSIEDIDAEVKPVISDIISEGDIQAQKVADSNAVIIKTRLLTLDERTEISKALAETFGVDETLITTENISATIGSEMRMDAVIAVVISLAGMLAYIWFRFKNLGFAVSAMFALLNDVLVVFAFYAISKTSVGGTFIACMLTIVGYSINATIIIFDRIRENLPQMKANGDLKDLVNVCINQTLSRSIYTNLTTFITIAVLYFVGVASIKEFALPLMIGIAYGTYSSVCVTGALWYVIRTKNRKNEK
ncbi:protein translocase subunit SecD [Anaerobium acetethylicum]|uniref:Multifunctional fusion protein n=1 Tax=Anaerobium acetethylicum TaxID=1619234 RepID=A0A1D3TT55_9FIRM|nr:protein translocase subunit SecD [Anaerobium acetethylicum]SCP97130.1 SecD/SecF fusion protein [Anaerobium acetethylicum]